MTRLRASEKSIYFIAVPLMLVSALAMIWLLPFTWDARYTITVLVVLGAAYTVFAYWLRSRRGWRGLRYLTPLVSVAFVTLASNALGTQASATYLFYFPAIIIQSIRYGRRIGIATALLAALAHSFLLQAANASASIAFDAALASLNLLLVAILSGALAEDSKFHAVVQGLTNYAVAMLDPRGHVQSWNDGAEKIQGYTFDEVRGQSFAQFYLPEARARGEPSQALALAAEQGRWEQEDWRVRKDGSQFWASVTLIALRDEAGQLTGYAHVMRDLTTRRQIETALQDAKQNLEIRVLERTAELEAVNRNLHFELSERLHTEELLRESEERYRTLVETSPDAIALSDLSGNIVMVNRQALKLFGYRDADELIGQNTLNLIDERDHLRALSDTVWLMESGELRNVEYTLHRRDGSTFAAEFSTTLVEDAVQKRPTALIHLIRDVSDRRQVETALRESESRFRAVFQHAAIGLSLRDLQGRVLESNPALQAFLGYGADELLNTNFLELLHPDDRAENARLHHEQIGGGREEYQRVNRYIRKDRTQVWGRVKVTLMRNTQGEAQFVLGMIEDISEQRRVEEELRKSNLQLSEGLNKLEQRHHETILLNQLGDLLQTCITTEEARSILAKHMPRLFPDEAGALFESDHAQHVLEARVVWSEPVLSNRDFAPHDCWALRRERVYMISDIASGFICPHLHGDNAQFNAAGAAMQGYLCVPMLTQGELLGLLHIQSRPNAVPIESKRELAETVAERVALALSNIKLRETLRIQSIRDSLTGVFNRRYMEESLPRELRRAARNRRSLGIIMLDIDHFKQFNDTYGHDAGDAMLRELGVFLQNNVRAEDIVCRYGGEEFTLILPDASLEHSRQRAEQLRVAVKDLHVQHNGHLFGQITLSLGISVFPEHGSTSETLLRAADAALYRAKALGRDCVVAGGE